MFYFHFHRPQIQRSQTGFPKSQSSNVVRNEFKLDIGDDGNKENNCVEMPQLMNTDDLDYLEKPIELPKLT